MLNRGLTLLAFVGVLLGRQCGAFLPNGGITKSSFVSSHVVPLVAASTAAESGGGAEGESADTELSSTTTPVNSATVAPSTSAPSPSSSGSLATREEDDGTFMDGLKQNLQMRLRIVQESNQQGYDIKQTLANVLAGEYDQDVIKAKIDTEIQSAPCVMFTWERSPSCVKAVEAFELMKIMDQVKIVRLDNPWEEGNPIRAELGKRLGRSSVPIVFIGGEYVGGFDGGVSDEAPGIQTMAFMGTLRPTLEAAGIKFANSS